MALGMMRRHRRWLYVFLWIVILGFVAFYIPLFQDTGASAGSPGETLARVGGEPITVGEYQKAYARVMRMYQGRLNPEMVKRMGLEGQILESLVADRIVALEAERLGLQVDDATLARTLTTDFQENGRFMGAAEIKRRLELQGMSPEEFERELRARLLRDQLEALIGGAVSVTPAEVEREYRRRNEQARIEYVEVPLPATPAEPPSEAEVAARFEKDREAYRLPEKRVVSHVLVTEEAVRGRATVTDRDLQQYYEQHRDEYKQEAQVCASHILVKVKAAPDAKEGHGDEEARRIAEGLLASVKGGADFAAVAQKSSEDQGSASRGGDLSCFGRGQMVPAFEDAAFALEAGQTSEIVKSSFGYHIIRVTSKRAAETPAFSVVKERIRPQLVDEKTQQLLAEQVRLGQDALRRGSLEDAAKALGLTVQKSAPLALSSPAEPLGTPALAARAFELKPGETDKEGGRVARGYVFFRLDEIKPPRVPELKEVAAQVRVDLEQERARETARAAAEALRTRAAALGLEKAASAQKLVRKETPGLVGRGQALGELGTGAPVEQAAFELEPGTLSGPVRSANGYAVLRVLERKGFDAAAFGQQKASIEDSLRQEKKSELFQAFLQKARERYAVERNPEALKRLLG
jgi:peptidyl-prolyl cis-trans isomerase D